MELLKNVLGKNKNAFFFFKFWEPRDCSGRHFIFNNVERFIPQKNTKSSIHFYEFMKTTWILSFAWVSTFHLIQIDMELPSSVEFRSTTFEEFDRQTHFAAPPFFNSKLIWQPTIKRQHQTRKIAVKTLIINRKFVNVIKICPLP